MNPIRRDQDELEFVLIQIDDLRRDAVSHADELDELIGTESSRLSEEFRNVIVPRQLCYVARSREAVYPAIAGVDADDRASQADHNRGKCCSTASIE